MKNLLTFLLLVFCLTVFGQSNSQTVEIKYWKSIAESNDTVAYRDYLQRYGENGLYYDEATTRIASIKTSGKPAYSKCIECCYYMKSKNLYNVKDEDDVYVLKFNIDNDNVCIRKTCYNKVRTNLAKSQDFYEKDQWITGKEKIREHKSFELNYIFFHDAKPNSDNIILNAVELNYSLMKSTSTRDVFFTRGIRKEWHKYKTGNSGTAHSSDYIPPDGYWKEFHGYEYYAVSKDKSSIIIWFEDDDNLDGQIFEKREYKLVPKEELLPKAVNYDFLNK